MRKKGGERKRERYEGRKKVSKNEIKKITILLPYVPGRLQNNKDDGIDDCL